MNDRTNVVDMLRQRRPIAHSRAQSAPPGVDTASLPRVGARPAVAASPSLDRDGEDAGQLDGISRLVDGFYAGLLGQCPVSEPLGLLRQRLRATRAIIVIRTGHDGEPLLMSSEADGIALAPGTDRFALNDAGNRVTGADTCLAGGTVCSLRAFRDRDQLPFDDRDRRLCESLVPHLRRALGLRIQIDSSESERALYSRVVNRLLVGVLILDERGQVTCATPMAQALLASQDGVKLIAGRPHAWSPAQDRELQQLIRETIGHFSAGACAAGVAMSLRRPSGARDLGLVVHGLAECDRSTGRPRAAAAIFLRDPERSVEVENNVLQQLFDLTPAEAEVARRLAEGLSLEEAAVSLKIRHNTARAHLRSIFAKSGITRQSDLVRILLNSAAVLGFGASLAVQ